MRTAHTLETFTPHLWEQLFGAFVLANRSHWRGAPYDAVLGLLKSKGRFEFSVTGMGTWTSKFVLTVLPDGHLDVTFVANEELSPAMRKHLEKMEEVFQTALQRIA